MAWRRVVGALAVVAALLALGAGIGLGRPGPPLPAPVTITISQGARLRTVADGLVRQGVLRHPLLLVAAARITGRDRDIQAGDFRIGAPLSPLALLDRLTGPPDALRVVTVPEGFTSLQVAAAVERAGLGAADRVLGVLADPAFLAREGLPASGAEGYLFPDTYAFALGTPPERLLHAMVERFRAVFDDTMLARATQLGLSRHAAVTLASLVEAEAARPDERALIAAVFLNRLRRGMPLQSDPTVLYGRAPGADRTITRDDLRRSTAHNTYVRPGLPPTPIGNPGRAALEAAVAPAPVAYLYFVARGDGSHEFTTTLDAHNAAVARHRPGRR